MTELHFEAPIEFSHRQAIEQVLAHLVWTDPGLQHITVSVWPLVRAGEGQYLPTPSGALRAAAGNRQTLDALVANSYAGNPSQPLLIQFAVGEARDLVAARRVQQDTRLSAVIVDGRRLYVQAPERSHLTVLVDQPWAQALAAHPAPPLLPYLRAPRWTLDIHGCRIGERLAHIERGLAWLAKLEAGTYPLGQHCRPLTLKEYGQMQEIIEACYHRWLGDGVEHLRYFSQPTLPVRRSREYLLARYPTIGHWMRHALVPSITVEDVSALWRETAALPPRDAAAQGTRCTLRRKDPPTKSPDSPIYPVIVTMALAIQDGIVLHLIPRARELPRKEFSGMQQLLRSEGLLLGLLTVAGDRLCSEVAAVGNPSGNS